MRKEDLTIGALSLEELKAKLMKKDLAALVNGTTQADRVYEIMELAIRWRYERTQLEQLEKSSKV